LEVQTLDELKLENDAENGNAEEEAAKLKAEQEAALAEGEPQEPVIPAEGELAEGGEPEVDQWMQTDEQASEGQQVSVAVLAKTRSKLKGKIGERDEEIERLKQENEALKSGQTQTPASAEQLPPRPKREDFDFDDDKYDAAIDAWQDKRMDLKLAQGQQVSERKGQAATQRENLNQAVDQHYERAEKLTKDSGITDEVYQQADRAVRSVIESIRPGEGDLIADQLIATVGEGSEKAMFWIGRNKQASEQLQASLVADPSGMRAIAFISKKAAELSAPKQRSSRAPKPAANAQGDASTSSNALALQRKYDEAHKAKNGQAAYDLKQQAKKAGHDVSKW